MLFIVNNVIYHIFVVNAYREQIERCHAIEVLEFFDKTIAGHTR